MKSVFVGSDTELSRNIAMALRGVRDTFEISDNKLLFIPWPCSMVSTALISANVLAVGSLPPRYCGPNDL